MPITGFSHYNLRAPRELLDALCRFYCEVVGLRRGDRPPFTNYGHWLYAGDRAVLHLSETRDGEIRSAEAKNTFDHAAFDCTGRDEVEQHLARHGIRYRTAHVPQTGVVQLFFSDPAGNGVELNFTERQA
jgi:catechol 2,3-dioxygenase-like lactoylglutathione lyase family enzyme